MKIPIKMDEEVLKILKTQGNIKTVPKYPNHQNLNNSIIKYYSFPDTVYEQDEEDNKFYITDEKVFFRFDWGKHYEDVINSHINLQSKYRELTDRLCILNTEMRKLPNFIKWLFNIKL